MTRALRLVSVRSAERVNSAEKAKAKTMKKSEKSDTASLSEAELRDLCEFTRDGGSVDDWILRNSLEI